MKYKVMLNINGTGGGNPDSTGSFSFYTFNQAHSACQLWAATDPGVTTAHLWDGSTWRYYS